MTKKAACICVIIALTFTIAEARPPFGGTIFVNRNIITPEDPSAFVSITPKGREKRRLPDRRGGRGQVNAYMFDAKFDDGQTMIVQVNPEFDEKEARKQAEKYLLVIGQMPFALRKDVVRVTINGGKKPFGGGGRGLLIHTGMGESYIRGGILAETLYHEASHTSLDGPHAHNKDWLAAQKKDPEFISGYAKHHPRREDVAETYLLYFAYRYKPGRIPDKLKETIKKTVPNRIVYFDSLKLKMHPVVETKESTAKAPPPVVADDLKRKISKVAFKDTPLSKAFQQLRYDSKVNISVHWLYLKAAGIGIDMKKKVTLSMTGVSLEKVLRSVLEAAAPGKLGFEIQKGVLVVSSKEALAEQAAKKKQKK